MHIQDFFQNFLKLFLVGLHDDCTINLIAQDMSPVTKVTTTESRPTPFLQQTDPLFFSCTNTLPSRSSTERQILFLRGALLESNKDGISKSPGENGHEMAFSLGQHSKPARSAVVVVQTREATKPTALSGQ